MSKRLERLYRQSKGICGICNESVEKEFLQYLEWKQRKVGRTLLARNEININIDHVIPKIMGGGNHMSNLQVAHSLCNYAKGSDWLYTVDPLVLAQREGILKTLWEQT